MFDICDFLPVLFRIKFNVALLVLKCLNKLATDFLKSLMNLRKI